MASTRWRPPGSVISRFAHAPESWDFVQAMRLIEAAGGLEYPQLLSGSLADIPQKSHLKARFVTDARTRFATATLTHAQHNEAEKTLFITVSGFGLLGSVGVLPFSYSALVTSSQHENNHALKAFIDIFQHRSVELFYQAASKYRIVAAYDRRQRGQPDSFTDALAGLIGLGSQALRNRMRLRDDIVLHFSGLFASKARTIAGLEALLGSVLGAPARILPLVGRWLSVAEAEQTRLGGCGASCIDTGQHCRLGSSAMLGSRVWSVQNSFRIIIGPIDAADIATMLPGGQASGIIADLVSIYCGLEYECDVNLVVKAASVPAARLVIRQNAKQPDHADMDAARLGQSSWVLSSPSLTDRDDAVLLLDQTI